MALAESRSRLAYPRAADDPCGAREPSGVAGRAQRILARGGKTYARTPMDQALSQVLPAVSGCGAGRRRGRGALLGPLVLLSGACGQGRGQSVPSPAGLPPPACRPARGQPAAARGRPPARGEGPYPRPQTNHRDEPRSRVVRPKSCSQADATAHPCDNTEPLHGADQKKRDMERTTTTSS
jgi:hypothetical protein